MRTALSSLTGQQRRTLACLGGMVLALAVAGGLLLNLSRVRAQNVTLKQNVEGKEREAKTADLPTIEEETRWNAQEQNLKDILLPDEAVPQLFEDISRIAFENHLQRLGITSEEKIVDATKQPPQPAEAPKLAAFGIRRYMSVTLKFQGDYPDVAKFLTDISRLRHAVEFQDVVLKRSVPLVEASVILRVYKREPA